MEFEFERLIKVKGFLKRGKVRKVFEVEFAILVFAFQDDKIGSNFVNR